MYYVPFSCLIYLLYICLELSLFTSCAPCLICNAVFVLGMFLSVSCVSSRAAVFVLFYATTVFTVYYTCFLISHLAVSSTTPPFTTLQEAHQAGIYTMGYVRSSSLDETFQA